MRNTERFRAGLLGERILPCSAWSSCCCCRCCLPRSVVLLICVLNSGHPESISSPGPQQVSYAHLLVMKRLASDGSVGAGAVEVGVAQPEGLRDLRVWGNPFWKGRAWEVGCMHGTMTRCLVLHAGWFRLVFEVARCVRPEFL